ncbi:hypothetical protein M3Y95_00388000 [Aphelenchoides besseyi]|nr:hypothetical protein M3Y95_00388000 [Aphelenchoides besseyi]
MILLEKDFKEGFYGSVIRSENVVIITNVDVDSLCAATILTNLLETDEVMYSLLAISSWSELKELFDEYSLLNNPPTHYVLLNCGGYRSFLEMEIELPKKSSIFIIDSKRPFHLDNVFSAEGIHVLCLDSELNELNLPEYSQIVDPNSQSDSDSDEEDAENQEISIAERVERRLLKRKEMAVHRQNRDQILFEYNRFTYTSIPTSVFLLKLAHSMGKSTAGLTWCAAVGLSSYQVENSISTQTYSAICLEHMKPFIRRFGPREKLRIDPNFRISFDRELQLPLYRHWTLNDSIFNNLFFICKARMWSHVGKDLVKHVYASLGIPLHECTENFESLSPERRKEIFEILAKYMNSEFFSFFSHLGYSRVYSAVDVARVLALILQPPRNQQQQAEERNSFLKAFQLLRYYITRNGGDTDEMKEAVHRYQNALQAMTTLIFDSVQQNRFLKIENYILLTIKSGKFAEVDYLYSQHCMKLFLPLALRVFHGTYRFERDIENLEPKKRAKVKRRLRKPLFVAVLNRQIDNTRWYTVSGSMSMIGSSDPERKSCIPQLFDKLNEDKNLHLIYDQIESNVILVREDSYGPFFSRIELELPAVDDT